MRPLLPCLHRGVLLACLPGLALLAADPARPRVDRRSAERMIEAVYREVLDRPADPEGLRRYLDRVLNEGWDQRALVEHLQRSPEARAIDAETTIRRLYQEELGRAPDASGLANYRAKWRQGWTQGRIREDLRRSSEGRSKGTREAITRAYRELLGREPDPAGLANYERLMREKGFTERDVRRALMSGEEYRQRQGR